MGAVTVPLLEIFKGISLVGVISLLNPIIPGANATIPDWVVITSAITPESGAGSDVINLPESEVLDELFEYTVTQADVDN
jgi:hypothetical protein